MPGLAEYAARPVPFIRDAPAVKPTTPTRLSGMIRVGVMPLNLGYRSTEELNLVKLPFSVAEVVCNPRRPRAVDFAAADLDIECILIERDAAHIKTAVKALCFIGEKPEIKNA